MADFFLILSFPTEQQYFDIDKRLAESQEQIVSATRDLQALKEENKKLSEFCSVNRCYKAERIRACMLSMPNSDPPIQVLQQKL